LLGGLPVKIWGLLAAHPKIQQTILRILGPTFLVGCAAVLENDEGKVVLFHHTYRGIYPWGLPGGWLKRGESPRQCLEREIREETGLNTLVGPPLENLIGRITGRLELLYAARVIGGSFVPSHEVDRIGAFDPEDLPEGIRKYHAAVIKSYFAAKRRDGLAGSFPDMPSSFTT